MPDVFYTKPEEPTHKVKYGKKPMNHITVRIPDGPGPHPTILALHGGKWKNAYTAKQLEYLCADLVKHGIACCNIEFKRLGHKNGGYPGTFLDLLDATGYILDHAEEWKLNKDKISLLGHSSGAHLAACLRDPRGHEGRTLQQHGDDLFMPYSMVLMAGVYDLTTVPRLKPEIDEFFGEHPILGPIKMLPTGIKQLVVCGTKDKLLKQAVTYAKKATQAGDDVAFLPIDKCSHFRIIDPTFPG